MTPVLALQRDPGLRARIRAGVRSGAAFGLVDSVRFASGWRELGRLTQQSPGSPAIVDPYHGADGPMPSGALAFQREHPSCPLIGYAAIDTDQRRSLLAARLRLVTLLLPELNDRLLCIGSSVLLGADYDAVLRMKKRLRAAVPQEAQEFAEHLVRETVGPCHVRMLARRLACCRRTLRRRCASWGTAPPRRLVTLAKLFHVERLARWSGQPRGAVALAVAYADYANYKRAVRREFGCPPSALGRRTGVDTVASRLIESCGGRS